MEKLVESKTSFATILIAILAIVFTPWGIYHTYNEHGYVQGIISTFFPPYAWYMVAESFEGHDDLEGDRVLVVLDFQASNGSVIQMSFRNPHPEATLDGCERELASGTNLVTSDLIASARETEPVLLGTAKFLGAKCVLSSDFDKGEVGSLQHAALTVV